MQRLKEIYDEDPSVAFVDEPDDEWRKFGLLDAFYEDKVNRALFQLTALATISARFSTALASGATTIVTERSIWSCFLCFTRMIVNDPYESSSYACAFYEIQRAIEAQHSLDVTFVYLDVDANVGWERMLNRGVVQNTPEDKEVTLAYQTALRAKHELFFDLAASNRIAKQCHPTDSPSVLSRSSRLVTRACRVDGAQPIEAVTRQLCKIIDERQLRSRTTLKTPASIPYRDCVRFFEGGEIDREKLEAFSASRATEPVYQSLLAHAMCA